MAAQYNHAKNAIKKIRKQVNLLSDFMQFKTKIYPLIQFTISGASGFVLE